MSCKREHIYHAKMFCKSVFPRLPGLEKIQSGEKRKYSMTNAKPYMETFIYKANVTKREHNN